MKTSVNGRKFIESYEGCILQSYDDSNNRLIEAGQKAKGTLTIGYGHTTAAGVPTVTPGMRITKQEASDILAKDLGKVENDVNRLVKVPLTQNQFDALVSFHFNTGSLGKSSALRYLNAGDYSKAADALLLYNKGRVDGKLVPMNGLVRRRNDEKKMFLAKPVQSGATAGTSVVVGGVVTAAATPTHYWPIIAVVTGILAFAVWLGYEWYQFGKVYGKTQMKEIKNVD